MSDTKEAPAVSILCHLGLHSGRWTEAKQETIKIIDENNKPAGSYTELRQYHTCVHCNFTKRRTVGRA